MRQLYIWFRKEKRLKGPLPDPGEIPEKKFLFEQSEGKQDAVGGTLGEILQVIDRSERFELGQHLRAATALKGKTKP